MMRLVAIALVVFLTACVLSCKESTPDTMFQLLSSEDTGIDFNNQIQESDSFNILTYEYIYNGGGVGIADFNNDSLKDVFFAGNLVSNKMYLNKGNFAFQDITPQANINVPGRWNSGVTVVDINNDGWLDIYVTATMRPGAEDRRNMLFVNNGLNAEGIPTFTEKAGSYGIADDGYSVMAAFLDYDKDDDLDLYVLTNARMNNVPTNFRPKIADGSAVNNDRLYRNNGDGTFTNTTIEAGILLEGFGLGLAVSDFNKDGWPDIYVSNDYLSNDILYMNNGNGTFTNKIGQYIGHQSQFSMGNDVADINNDALPDIITTDMLPETNARKKTTIGNKSYSTYINNERYGYEYQYVRNMLHLNNGLDRGVKFSEIGQLAGVYQTEWSWSPLFVDANNDGYKDLFITNGFPKDITDKDFSNYRADVGNIATPGLLNDSIPVIKIPNYAFRNNGALAFTDVTEEWGLGLKSFSNGAAFADLDNDGDLDYITNNINDKAFVFKNTLNDPGEKKSTNGYLDIKLEGSAGNRMGIGSKVTLFSEGKTQYYEEFIYRGFLSSVDAQIHFGLGAASKIDSLVVTWPDGKKSVQLNVLANQVVTIAYPEHAPAPAKSVGPAIGKMFDERSASLNLNFKHTDNDAIDFNLQRTLPHKFSQSGPGLAVGDVNNDGLDDLVIGGSVNFNAVSYIQQKNGTFAMSKTAGKPLETDAGKTEEDEGLLLFDADGDNDLDLYVVGGGFEGTEPNEYRDRLYFNNKGTFKLDTTALPITNASGSCVRAADFDNDGDLDLFVGGRITPASYPVPGESYLLVNDKGRFTNSASDEMKNVGMVTDALWTDYDNDGKIDLILAGEFMPLTFFHNDGGKLTKVADTGIQGETGWWNSVVGGDFDNDGDIDYVAGNLGLNNNFQVSGAYPLKCYFKDFDGNGSIDPIVACYARESMDGTKRDLFPVHFWEEMNSQSPKFRRKYARFKQFSKATMETLLSADDMKGAAVVEASNLSTSYVENLGGGKFRMTALPVEAQIAPVNGIVVDDIDDDGNLDVLLIGNDYGNEVFAGRYDASTGLLLKGNGVGVFTPSKSSETGFVVDGDAKALVKITGKGRDIYVASQNKGPLKAFVVERPNGYVCTPEKGDVFCEIKLADGKTRKQEFYFGSGYLSQSGRSIRVPKGAVSVTIHNADGKARIVDVLKTDQRISFVDLK
ncbi:MAG TPA: VCBS repeat-containing protein [Cyclobacteriaceae bacterium]|nr:VCBS repeat-containing protein [Cyclobacteriaceae bacterium]